MSSPFAVRRKARKIGQDEDADEDAGGRGPGEEQEFKRPNVANKPKKSSKLRLSFGLGQEATEDEDGVFEPKKSTLSVQQKERSTTRRPLGASVSIEQLRIRENEQERPSYSKDYLNELRNSTPSTPQGELIQRNGETQLVQGISADDFVSPQGVSSAIPSEVEIREKKERRARLAKEQEYISLNDENEDDFALRFVKEKDTRLVRDDEDFAEGFEEFVDDGRVALSKNEERRETTKKREEIAELIRHAEQSSSDESDDSIAEAKAAFNDAQTQAGTYAMPTKEESRKAHVPPKIAPLPDLKKVLDGLQSQLALMEASKDQKVKALEELVHQQGEIAVREEEIQRLLKETGDRYEQLRVEAGISNDNSEPSTGSPFIGQRGLESLGGTPLRQSDTMYN